MAFKSDFLPMFVILRSVKKCAAAWSVAGAHSIYPPSVSRDEVGTTDWLALIAGEKRTCMFHVVYGVKSIQLDWLAFDGKNNRTKLRTKNARECPPPQKFHFIRGLKRNNGNFCSGIMALVFRE